VAWQDSRWDGFQYQGANRIDAATVVSPNAPEYHSELEPACR